MPASPFVRTEVRAGSSEAPMALDVGSAPHVVAPPSLVATWASRIPPSWIGMSGYLVAGVFLGLIMILALSLTHGDATPTTTGIVTDNIVHVQTGQLAEACWRKTPRTKGPTRVTVSLEVGLDGKVRNAIASGEATPLRGCIESHVKGWQFLPQANPSQMVLPVEIDR